MDKKLFHIFYWASLDDSTVIRFLREFQDHGISDFVFTAAMLKRGCEEPGYLDFLEKCRREFHVDFGGAHGFYQEEGDLNVDEHDEMVARHLKALDVCGRFGIRTYTVHPGAFMYCSRNNPLDMLRERAMRTLEKLLPAAEKNKVIIAVENSFEPPNTPQEVMRYVNEFLPSPYIGVCFDTGHANMMAATAGKDLQQLPAYQVRNWSKEGGIKLEPDALGVLFDHVVTVHMHDNNGYADLHGMPGDGTIDWKPLVARLRQCPRMVEFQTEVCFASGTNWAGKLLAPEGGYTVKRVVEAFRAIGF